MDCMGTYARVLCVLVTFYGGLRPAPAAFLLGTPENLGPVINQGTSEVEPSISADGLSLYFSQGAVGVNQGIYVARRATMEADWTAPTRLGSQIHGTVYNGGQHISSDGLTLYYSPMLPGEYGGPGDLWKVVRATHDDPWSAPVNMGPVVNSAAEEWTPSVTGDELTLCFMSSRAGGRGGIDLWITTRPTKADDWLAPANLGPAVNSSNFDGHPSISADGLTVFFQSNRPGGSGNYDLWVSTRKAADAPWTAARNLGPLVNSGSMDGEPSISADGAMLYFSSDRPGGNGSYDLWQVSITPIVDLNSDGRVEIKDLLKLIECWGQEDATVDIAPLPFGDGVVDAADLEVLMGSWGQDIDDPRLLTHWRLDETEGLIAHDTVGGCDGILAGEPAWMPDAGVMGGTLEFDGVDDLVAADCGLNPADGPFSLFAWIKGGLAGQAMVSQTGGENWLRADPVTGALVTELRGAGRSSNPLRSEAVVTDGDWHRVGLVWEGEARTLYVDDVVVAEDIQTGGVTGCAGALNIGCGKDMSPGTFFAGLIDDVRIYDRAVRP